MAVVLSHEDRSPVITNKDAKKYLSLRDLFDSAQKLCPQKLISDGFSVIDNFISAKLIYQSEMHKPFRTATHQRINAIVTIMEI